MKKILCLLLLVLVCPLGAAASAQPGIVVLGDSLSAAYGIERAQGWVSLLRDKLQAEGYPHTLVNASISGETTSGGLRRLPAVLNEHEPQVVIIELGGNDGLRALSLDSMRDNLAAMVEQSQGAGAKVLLLGMHIPSNYGPAYTEKFHAVFGKVAQDQNVALLEFFLAPVALKQRYFLDDGIHPNAKAQPLLVKHVWPALRPLLEK